VDANGNQARTAGEVALVGARVSLHNPAGEFEGEAFTTDTGAFVFINVQPGGHKLRFAASGYMATTPGDLNITLTSANIANLARGFVRGGLQPRDRRRNWAADGQ